MDKNQFLQKDLRLVKRSILISKILTVVLFVSILFFCFLVWRQWHLKQKTEELNNKSVALASNMRRIMHLDEVLTMSARMCSATGDLFYEKRYKSYEPLLDALIKETISLFPEAKAAEKVKETDEANQALVKMEYESFSLVKSGKKSEGLKLLNGSGYMRQKEIYSQGIEKAFEHLERARSQKMKQEQTRYWLSFGGILLGILIISIAWMVSLAVTKRWIKERTLIEEERERFQQQFIQSEKMSAIGQLAGGVAHEINNPLGVILGFAQSIANKIKEGDPLTLPIQSMEREAKRCKKLVQDLLTFSRVGKTEKELCDLNEVLQSALSLVETQTKVNSVELLKDFGDDIGKIMVNRNQIQQVLINLCNNAIDAMPKGGTLTISTKVLSRQSPPEARISPRFGEAGAKGGLVTSQKLNGPGQGPGSKDSPRREAGQGQKNIQIVVSDTGDGMPKEIQSKIFEPFFTTKPVGKGTGLGLSLVYEIIQKHEGTIEVESEAGRGTSFIIMLPITK